MKPDDPQPSSDAGAPDDGWADRTLLVSRLAFSDTRASDSEQVTCLLVVDGAEPGTRLEIGSQPVVFGRAEPADFVVPDGEVSRRHCEVRVDDGDIVVTDLGSTNGTFIDGVRVSGAARLRPGGILQLGRQVLKCERLSRHEAEQADELARDLVRAQRYVQSLLPQPITSGPVLTDWFFLPCPTLGGDLFGYQPLADDHFALYLIDVAGHGAGAAMHSVTVQNALRQRALPPEELLHPARTAAALNRMFQMSSRGGMYCSLWYGVYDGRSRRLAYCSAGHHPAYLVGGDPRSARPLKTANPVIGASPNTRYEQDAVDVPPGAMLYLFSDGVFEITTASGEAWGLAEVVRLIVQPPDPAVVEPQRIYRAVRAASRDGRLDDDFSLLVATFT